MSAKTPKEKIDLAMQLEAQGMTREAISKVVGVNVTSLRKYMGQAEKKTTNWRLCECGDHEFARVSSRDVCLVDPGVPGGLLAGKALFVTQGRPRKKIVHRYAIISDWPHHHLRVHRVIMDAKADQIVDHISRDTMDNRRRNLRIATDSLNSANSIQKGGTSKYKGVSWDKKRGCWVAGIMINRHRRWLGNFEDEAAAARAYDAAATATFGEFARINFGSG